MRRAQRAKGTHGNATGTAFRAGPGHATALGAPEKAPRVAVGRGVWVGGKNAPGVFPDAGQRRGPPNAPGRIKECSRMGDP